ncbi:MAG: hypothetical protein GY830_03595 [Bacteroidetes bacterium]|nr:hypothetical protein [Bacteroidota bacterium]
MKLIKIKMFLTFLLLNCNIYNNKNAQKLRLIKEENKSLDKQFSHYLKSFDKYYYKLQRKDFSIILYSNYFLYKQLEFKVNKLIANRLKIEEIDKKELFYYYDIINKFKYFFIINSINYFNAISQHQMYKKSYSKYNPFTCFRMLLKWFKLKIKFYRNKQSLKNFSAYLANGRNIYYNKDTFGDIIKNKLLIKAFINSKRKQEVNQYNLLHKYNDERLYPIITCFFSENKIYFEKIKYCFNAYEIRPKFFKTPYSKSQKHNNQI